MELDPNRRYTAEEFSWLSGCDDFELIDGCLEPLIDGAMACYIGGRLRISLMKWAERNRDWVFGTGAGYCCFPNRPNLVRRPIISVVASSRLSAAELPDVDHLRIPPEVACYVVSPVHSYGSIQAAALDWLRAGTRLVWVVSVETKSVLIRRLDGTCSEVFEDGELSGEDGIPGFTCKVAELFR
jgi:Uma2 family endonuclease